MFNSGQNVHPQSLDLFIHNLLFCLGINVFFNFPDSLVLNLGFFVLQFWSSKSYSWKTAGYGWKCTVSYTVDCMVM